jgi:hypothetical protein
VAALTQAGLHDVRVVKRYDCFKGTSKEKTARKYGVVGVDVLATKP